MNKIILIFLSVFFTGFYSCNNAEDPELEQPIDHASEQNRSNEDASFTKKEQGSEAKDQDDKSKTDKKEKSENKFNTRSITVKFPVGSTQITLDGNINGFGDKISYEFEASKGQTLNASVIPKDGQGNVSINQIYFPDGKADGPFGEKMTYKLTESGNWKLIIGEDMMAGEPWKGTYFLTIEIK